MKRRNFLRSLLPLSVAAAAGITLSFPMVARAAANKRLVVVFQRGGCDGLNAVVPHGDDDYYNLRPNLAIAAPQQANGDSAVAIGSDLFSLHPAMSALADVYLGGDLAIMPSVQFPHAHRSHFVNQELLEAGMSDTAVDGWLNRYLQFNAGGGELPAASLGTSLASSMRGEVPVTVLGQVSILGGFDQNLLTGISNMYGHNTDAGMSNTDLVHTHGKLMLDDLEKFSYLSGESYVPANSAVYPDSDFGIRMRQVAHIIKGNLGLEVASVDSYGWDTHSNQGAAVGKQAKHLADFANTLAAFHADLGYAYMQDTVVLVMTEFGRSVKENASGGTDHGHASTWYAMGGGVTGGLYGDWPGLSAENLHEERYLSQTLDSRDVVSEVLSKHMGQSATLSSLIPNHLYQGVGFL
jgi:uncharacterized protein (DUF1501 family)